ncbi:MAG TPA: hypothetical protein VMM55_14550 [Thermohalobaculum sp.]|nr:hypothetical protein [Thermohalobaculum sp.]
MTQIPSVPSTSAAVRGATVSAVLLAASLLALPAGAMAATAERPSAPLGAGEVSVRAELTPDGAAPSAIVLRFDEASLSDLPSERNTTGRCFDIDADGAFADGECEGDYELRLALPPELSARGDVPFGWVMVNWNPGGHPPGPWQIGHFDVHFYMMPEAELDAIGLGPCGILMDCEDFERAIVPVPPRYVHPDHVNVDAAVGGMGNHLIDSKTPELMDAKNAFTHTWVFGAYDGEIIFYEVMLTPVYMTLGQSGCHPIKQPEAWQKAGWYPTSYCIRFDTETRAHEISLEDFVLREAS